MPRREPKIVFGDATRREALALPATFAELQRRCQKAMGCYCELYLDSGANGRFNSESQDVRLTTEAQYQIVQDKDVVILVDPAGRRLNLKELGSIFDDLTTYRQDYVEHPIRKVRPREEVAYLDTDPVLDISALCYKTTYNAHYKPIPIPKAASYPPAPKREPDQCATGHTTYECDYIRYPHKSRPAVEEDKREITKPWSQDYRSTYNCDYKQGYAPRGERKAGWCDDYPKAPDGAEWRKTEYNEEYVKKDRGELNTDEGYVEDRGCYTESNADWNTTHRSTYVDHGRNKQQILFVDPEDAKKRQFK